MKTRIILYIAAVILLIAGICAIRAGAQTNEPATNLPDFHSPSWKAKTANDAATFISDFGITITGREILSGIGVLTAVFGSSRFLRKVLPDGWQANKFGLTLAHLAFEINPTLEKLKTASESPGGQVAIEAIKAEIAKQIAAGQPPKPT